MKSKKEYIFILCFLLLVGCSSKYETFKTIKFIPNFSNKKLYTIGVHIDSKQDEPPVAVTVFYKKRNINHILLGDLPVTLKFLISQKKISFSLLKAINIKGTISLIPENKNEADLSIQLPFNVKINSWITTHSGFIFVLLIVISLIYLINILMIFIKPAATGSVEFLIPANLSYPIYPRSRFNHFNRNVFLIGSNAMDDYFFEGSSDLLPSHINLKYIRKLRNVFVKVNSKKDLYHKKINDVNYIIDPDFEGPSEYAPQIADFNLPKDRLLLYGYESVKSFKIKIHESYIMVLSDKLVLKISV